MEISRVEHLFSGDKRLIGIWNNSEIPAVFKRGKGYGLLVHLPYAENNWDWIRSGIRTRPRWCAGLKSWEVPVSWFNDIVDRSLFHYGKIYVLQNYKVQQKCAPACWNAKGNDCSCSCMGEHHGTEQSAGNWYKVSDTFAFSWSESAYSCRLLTRR